jgi:hypothetical protein
MPGSEMTQMSVSTRERERERASMPRDEQANKEMLPPDAFSQLRGERRAESGKREGWHDIKISGSTGAETKSIDRYREKKRRNKRKREGGKEPSISPVQFTDRFPKSSKRRGEKQYTTMRRTAAAKQKQGLMVN